MESLGSVILEQEVEVPFSGQRKPDHTPIKPMNLTFNKSKSVSGIPTVL